MHSLRCLRDENVTLDLNVAFHGCRGLSTNDVSTWKCRISFWVEGLECRWKL